MHQIDPEEFNRRVEERLSNMDIDFEIKSEWYDFAAKAFRFVSPLSLGIEPSRMEELIDKCQSRKRLNYLDFAIISNVVQARTAHEMEPLIKTNPYTYMQVMVIGEEYSELWNTKGKVINNEVMADLVRRTSAPVMPMAKA